MRRGGKYPVFIDALVLVDCRDESNPDAPLDRVSPFGPRHLRCPGVLLHEKDRSKRVYGVTVCRCACHAPRYKARIGVEEKPEDLLGAPFFKKPRLSWTPNEERPRRANGRRRRAP